MKRNNLYSGLVTHLVDDGALLSKYYENENNKHTLYINLLKIY